jgi:hypothetical protein
MCSSIAERPCRSLKQCGLISSNEAACKLAGLHQTTRHTVSTMRGSFQHTREWRPYWAAARNGWASPAGEIECWTNYRHIPPANPRIFYSRITIHDRQGGRLKSHRSPHIKDGTSQVPLGIWKLILMGFPQLWGLACWYNHDSYYPYRIRCYTHSIYINDVSDAGLPM